MSITRIRSSTAQAEACGADRQQCNPSTRVVEERHEVGKATGLSLARAVREADAVVACR
jgi:hypothetical protein